MGARVRDQVDALEQRLRALADALMDIEDRRELNRIETEIRAAALAIRHYTTASDISFEAHLSTSVRTTLSKEATEAQSTIRVRAQRSSKKILRPDSMSRFETGRLLDKRNVRRNRA